jgi:2-oxo-4-hydroxy-4-carboxy-5-ureidoimidazoline decarboxylase
MHSCQIQYLSRWGGEQIADLGAYIVFMTIDEFNALSESSAARELERCCGSRQWVTEMMRQRPFRSLQHLLDAADIASKLLSEDDWKEAFRHHPRIGDAAALEKKFFSTQTWASAEQSGMIGASRNIADEFMQLNERYEKTFGYIYVVCATGKTAEEMHADISQRILNTPARELATASAEQTKITRLRLQKLLTTA